MFNCLNGLGHEALVRSDDEQQQVRNERRLVPHGNQRSMTGSVQQGDLARPAAARMARDGNGPGLDALRGFAGPGRRGIRVAQRIDQGGLAVSGLTHHHDNRGARFQYARNRIRGRAGMHLEAQIRTTGMMGESGPAARIKKHVGLRQLMGCDCHLLNLIPRHEGRQLTDQVDCLGQLHRGSAAGVLRQQPLDAGLAPVKVGPRIPGGKGFERQRHFLPGPVAGANHWRVFAPALRAGVVHLPGIQVGQAEIGGFPALGEAEIEQHRLAQRLPQRADRCSDVLVRVQGMKCAALLPRQSQQQRIVEGDINAETMQSQSRRLLYHLQNLPLVSNLGVRHQHDIGPPAARVFPDQLQHMRQRGPELGAACGSHLRQVPEVPVRQQLLGRQGRFSKVYESGLEQGNRRAILRGQHPDAALQCLDRLLPLLTLHAA